MKFSIGEIVRTSAGLLGMLTPDGKYSAAMESVRQNALPCLNAVLSEVSGFNSAATGEAISPSHISSLSDSIECDEYIGYAVIPCGLAKYLAVRFDPELAAYYKSAYGEALRTFRTRHKAECAPMKEEY